MARGGVGDGGGGGGGSASTVVTIVPADDAGGGDAALRAALLPRGNKYTRCTSHAGDELKSFRSCLRWMCVDQSDPWSAAISWSLFLLLGVAVPAASHFVLSYLPGRRAYDAAVQLSLTGASALAYISLSNFVRRFGLRRFLFLDKLVGESERVRLGYTAQLSRSFHLLSFFVAPCFAAECAYKAWWYATGSERTPFKIAGSAVAGDAVACVLELASWIYRMAIFFLVCVLFRLMCYLQILRLDDFAGVFGEESDVAAVLRDHLRIRRQLRIISHRFRRFIVSCLVLVTVSQFVSLLLTTRAHAEVNVFNAGELALCSIGLVTGLLICLRSAAKITHKAQAITSHAATWHACATIEASDTDPQIVLPQASTIRVVSSPLARGGGGDLSDEDGEEDELDDNKLPTPSYSTISFQKRQALVTYLENNRAGISVFGFVVDRTWLHALFMIELSLVMWLLGKTVGIS